MLIQHCLELGIMIFRHNMSQFMYHHILYAWLRVLMGANLSPCFTLIEQALSVFFNVNYI